MQSRAPLTLWPEGHQMLKTHEERLKKKTVKKPMKRKADMTEEEVSSAPFWLRPYRLRDTKALFFEIKLVRLFSDYAIMVMH